MLTSDPMTKAERLTARAEALKAEATLAEAEEAFVALKLAGKATAKDRQALFEMRQEFRIAHRTAKPGASAPPITTKAQT